MCEFCKVETIGGKSDMTNDIGGTFIGIGDYVTNKIIDKKSETK